ncbi:MAG: L,D-transpeptidase family protein [Oscillospiraceae bacterium]|nr:L,D-transpeptidase family protein [Oscillospiraceae bacterium]
MKNLSNSFKKSIKRAKAILGAVGRQLKKHMEWLYGNSKGKKIAAGATAVIVVSIAVLACMLSFSNFAIPVSAPVGVIDGEHKVAEPDDFDVSTEEVEITEESDIAAAPEPGEAESSQASAPEAEGEQSLQSEPLTGISSIKNSYSVYKDKSVKVGVVYTPTYAANKRLNWSSSNTDVAAVDSNGLVTGKAEGTCTVKAVSATNSALWISVSITVSKAPVAADSVYAIKVYKGSQSVCVYKKDDSGKYTVLVKAMTCSTGTGKGETPNANFRILRKYRWKELMGPSWEQYCSAISDSFLFHSIPYNRQNDPSSMSMGGYRSLGRRASHGCIRLACRDAKWIYDNAPIGTPVEIVSGSGPKGSIVPLSSDSYYSGWDPTDPSPNNPYNKNPPKATTTTVKTTTTTIQKTAATTVKTTTKETTKATEKPTTKPTTQVEETKTTTKPTTTTTKPTTTVPKTTTIDDE